MSKGDEEDPFVLGNRYPCCGGRARLTRASRRALWRKCKQCGTRWRVRKTQADVGERWSKDGSRYIRFVWERQLQLPGIVNNP